MNNSLLIWILFISLIPQTFFASEVLHGSEDQSETRKARPVEQDESCVSLAARIRQKKQEIRELEASMGPADGLEIKYGASNLPVFVRDGGHVPVSIPPEIELKLLSEDLNKRKAAVANVEQWHIDEGHYDRTLDIINMLETRVRELRQSLRIGK